MADRPNPFSVLGGNPHSPGPRGPQPQPAPTQTQQIMVVRPTVEPLAPGDQAELVGQGKAVDDYVLLEMRPVNGGLSINMMPDGSIVFSGQFVLPHDQIVNGPSKLLIGVNPQPAMLAWFRDVMGICTQPRMQLAVKRDAVIDPMAEREFVEFEELGEGAADPEEPAGGPPVVDID